MKKNHSGFPTEKEKYLPWNLTEWFDPVTLLGWIREEMETLDWANPEVVDYLKKNPSYRPQELMCLLGFAYATGAFDSTEIFRRIRTDEIFQKICGDHPPARSNDLTRFRRQNFGLLKWLLIQVFKRAVKEKFGHEFLPAGMKKRLLDEALNRLEVARQSDRGSDGS